MSFGFLLLIISLFLIGGSALTHSSENPIGISIGCLIGLANYYLLTLIIRGLVGNAISKPRLWGAIGLKFLIILPIIGLILLKTDVRALPLLIGLTNIFLATVVYGIKGIFYA
ncbi:MAG: hypothetical protein Q7S00_04710 [bacterium]|nr:hypothetical protein [bacterium]